jgi:D-glycero-D-manno-heptose 1,7-bisphosphate phosphatase
MTGREEGVSATPSVVILDRDGTIVIDRQYLSDPADLEFEPGAAEGLRRLHEHRHRLVVVTNQSGIGRGMFTLERLAEVHARFEAMVTEAGARLAGIYFCPHAPADGCLCRKPGSQLMLRAAADLGFDPADAVVIGDKMSDIEFGARSGAKTILVAGRDRSSARLEPQPDFIAANLLEAADWIDSQ